MKKSVTGVAMLLVGGLMVLALVVALVGAVCASCCRGRAWSNSSLSSLAAF